MVHLIRPGTSVGVYGTMTSADAASVTYCIDDSLPIAMSTSQEPYRRLLFQSETLPDEEHRLVVTQTSNNSPFSLDYLLYQPSAFMPDSRLPPAVLVTRQDASNPLTLLTPGVAVVDDFNTSSVLFQGSWTTGGQSVEYNRTTHGTYAAGSIATLNFTGMRSQLEPTNRDRDRHASRYIRRGVWLHLAIPGIGVILHHRQLNPRRLHLADIEQYTL